MQRDQKRLQDHSLLFPPRIGVLIGWGRVQAATVMGEANESKPSSLGRGRVTLSHTFSREGPENQERHIAEAQGHGVDPRLSLNQKTDTETKAIT